jgi:DNA-binding LacI/PurR family transcriptional regulator
MIIGQSNESYEEEKSLVRTFASIRVDGFLFSPSSETKNFDHLLILTENNIPLVIFDRDCEGIEVDKVFVDEYKGAFQAVEHLIKTGCRRIAHIAGPPTLSTVKHRLEAYKDALKQYGLPVSQEYIVEAEGFMPEHGIDPTKQLLALPIPPDAIFTINDGVAIGAMYIIKEAGIKIPDEISIIGFDDDPHSCYFKPSLSTVWQPTYELGMLSARILMKRVNSNNDLSNIRLEKLFPELIVRGSSK